MGRSWCHTRIPGTRASTVEGLTVEGLTVEGLTVEGLTVEGLTVEGLTAGAPAGAGDQGPVPDADGCLCSRGRTMRTP